MSAKINLIWRRFGDLLVLARSPRRGKRGVAYWVCQCACGRLTEARQPNLLEGRTRSCGCRRISALTLMAAKERSRVDRRDRRLRAQFPTAAKPREARRVRRADSPTPEMDFSDL